LPAMGVLSVFEVVKFQGTNIENINMI